MACDGGLVYRFKRTYSLSGTIIEVSIVNLISDAGRAVARRRRDISKHFSLSCLCTAFLNLLESFCNLPDHHWSFYLLSYLVVGDLFKSFTKASTLRRSFSPARSFRTFCRSTWSPVRTINGTTTSIRTSALSHLSVKRSMKLLSNHETSTTPLRRAVGSTKSPIPSLSRFVPPSRRSTQPLNVMALPRRLLHMTTSSDEKLGFLNWGKFWAYGQMGLVNLKPIPSFALTHVYILSKPFSPSRLLFSCLCYIYGCRSRNLFSGETLKDLRDEVVVRLPNPNSIPTINYETLLASHGFRPNLQTPRSFLSILLLPIRHCLGSLVDLDVRRLHLRLWLPRMFGIYIGSARILVNAPFVTLFATSYYWEKQVCLNLLLVPSAPTCQLLPQGRRLGSDLNSQGQTDYKLCVEFLNLHGQWLHVREDPPALLRLVTHQMRFLVSFSSKATSTWQPSNPLVSSVEHTLKSSYAFIVRAKFDHLLVRDFMKLVFKLESYKTSKDLPSFASSSRLCIFLEDSCSLYLYISCNPLLLSCKNIPLLMF